MPRIYIQPQSLKTTTGQDLLKRDLVELDKLIAELDQQGQVAVAVFDACREIPQLEKSSQAVFGDASPFRGLARQERRPASFVGVIKLFKDYKGLFMLHCHNLEHEDMGMMREFRTCPSQITLCLFNSDGRFAMAQYKPNRKGQDDQSEKK